MYHQPKFFQNEKLVCELRKQLQSLKLDERTAAAEKVLKSLLKGNNLDELFPDMLKCAHTHCFKLKKLVYMFLALTAEKQPELAMLAANTLTMDLSSHLPIIRAFALRTIVRMGIESLIQLLGMPLQDSLSDENPYVRKTAALCVAKLLHTQGAWIKEMGFMDRLRELMLRESNCAVLVNVVATLMEAGELDNMEFSTVNMLLIALSEAHEWGQVVILEALTRYKTHLNMEMRTIWMRVTPFLAHVNAAVALTAVRVLIPLIDANPENFESTKPKLASSLKTILMSQPELQYVALRNIHIILQKYPDLFKNDYRAFFLKYNDPIYVKMEKLEIMVRLAGTDNMVGILSELEEYAKEADVDLVRHSVRAIGRCAIRVDQTSGYCVNALLRLVETDVDYIVESVVIAFRDIFRRYPGTYENVLKILSEHIETLDEPEARAAFIWMLGEYNVFINNAEEILESFTQDFHDQDSNMQFAILTAVVKLFLHQPTMSHLVMSVLEKAIESQNPDLRDRAFIYWRLLSTDPNTAQMIVLAEKPPITDASNDYDKDRVNELINEIGNLASITHSLIL